MGKEVTIGDALLQHGNCLELLPRLGAGSVNLIAADLPYGTTQCAWDSLIPLDDLWAEYRRVLAPGGCVVLTAAMPFTAVLVGSNLSWFRHDVVWQKNRPTGHLNANRAPLRAHESILVFSPGQHTYNPQKTSGHRPVNHFYTRASGDCFGSAERETAGGGQTTRYPTSIQPFPVVSNIGSERVHPTQKPLSLIEWIVATYSNPGDMVLDNCFGSGTTAVAALRLGRSFVGMEMDDDYFAAAVSRLRAEQQQDNRDEAA